MAFDLAFEFGDLPIFSGFEIEVGQLRDGGFQPGQLIVVGARPSIGKSAFALNIATHLVDQRGTAVAFFGLEMSAEDMAGRVLSERSSIDSYHLDGRLSESDFESLAKTISGLSGKGFYINDNGVLTLLVLQSRFVWCSGAVVAASCDGLVSASPQRPI